LNHNGNRLCWHNGLEGRMDSYYFNWPEGGYPYREPVITANGHELSCDFDAGGYQWYRNGEAIDGATPSTHTATESGGYHVEVQLGECMLTSNSITVTITPDPPVGIAQQQATRFNIYPNPSDGTFTIGLDQQTEQVDLTVYSVHGQEVFREQYREVSLIDIQNRLEKGIYLIHMVLNGSENLSYKLMVQ
jgi:hypothetical protein